MAKDEMVEWHYRVNGNKFEQAREMVKGREPCLAAVHGVTESDRPERLHSHKLCHSFPSKEQVFFFLFVCFVCLFFNFMVAVTIHNDFGAQENKTCNCFHFSPFCLP